MATKFSSPLDKGARLTSNFSKNRYLFGVWMNHAGTDWADSVVRDKTPVYAVAAGTVAATGTGVLAGHSGNIVVIDHGILTDSSGSDWTRTNYGHLKTILVKKGQKVKAGQLIAYMGATGHVTGKHLHLGVRFGNTFYNPVPWLKKKGIVVGTTAPLKASTSHAATTKPSTSSSSSKTSSTSSRKHSVAVKTIQKRLKNMGYNVTVNGKDSAALRNTIKKYQMGQIYPANAYKSDGQWGPLMEAHYKWVVKLQTAMNKWKSKYTKLKVDGFYGANTKARVRDIKSRNHGGTFKGTVNYTPDKIFTKMIGISTHPRVK